MEAEELLRAGRLEEARDALERAIRSNPADAKLRIFFFQLLAVLGQWERSLTQLKVAAELDALHLLVAQMYGDALRCEALRREVFTGERIPLIFGEPEAWVGWLVQANTLTAQGKDEAAEELRQQAFEAAPAIAGTIDDDSFAWIADGDSRLGPVVEAVLKGQYYWIPFQRIKEIQLSPPKDLFDLVWAPAQFTWVNNGQSQGLIPVRYPLSEESQDDAVRLARKTEWLERPGGACLGLGQRMLVTDGQEYALLSARRITLRPPDEKVETDGGADG